MVIFTNESSQHLLLNRDLIDIALNCLENYGSCTEEAKKHVARLISIIFKFPQVQGKLMTSLEAVVPGICDLLKLTKYPEVIAHTVQAVSYLSMNFGFISDQRTQPILRRLLTLLLKEQTDKEGILLAIRNLLRGDKASKMWFYKAGGTKHLLEIIAGSDNPTVLEHCVAALAEQAFYKKVVVLMIEEQAESLEACIAKCLEFTRLWSIADTMQEKEKEASEIAGADGDEKL